MPSPFDSVNSKLYLEEQQAGFFADTIYALKQAIEGLGQLAGIEGLDSVAIKLQEAGEECEIIMSPQPEVLPHVYPTSDEQQDL